MDIKGWLSGLKDDLHEDESQYHASAYVDASALISLVGKTLRPFDPTTKTFVKEFTLCLTAYDEATKTFTIRHSVQEGEAEVTLESIVESGGAFLVEDDELVYTPHGVYKRGPAPKADGGEETGGWLQEWAAAIAATEAKAAAARAAARAAAKEAEDAKEAAETAAAIGRAEAAAKANGWAVTAAPGDNGEAKEAKADDELKAAQAAVGGSSDKGGAGLYAAAAKGNVRLLQAMLLAGADAAFRDPMSGHTSLTVAANFGYDACVASLLQCGADPNVGGCRGKTALQIAAKQKAFTDEDGAKKYEAIEVLIKAHGGRAAE